MIGRLRGTLLEKQPPQLLLDVSGVAYEIEAPMSTFYKLPETGQETILHTHFSVREDAQLLFGFASTTERKLFRTLIKVNGVGPKLALTLLSSIEPEQFVQCVQQDDLNRLIKVPGVGKKTAQRLLVEMQDKLKDWDQPAGNNTIQASLQSEQGSSIPSSLEEAISALISLGYKPNDANKAVSKVKDMAENTEDLIRFALKSF